MYDEFSERFIQEKEDDASEPIDDGELEEDDLDVDPGAPEEEEEF